MIDMKKAVPFLLGLLLMLLTLAAQADVLVCGRMEDVYAAQAHITADTQVLVMTTLSAKENDTLTAWLAERGAAQAVSLQFKKLKGYKAADLKTSWKTGVKAYPRLLARLRVCGEEEVRWYVDPELEALRETVGKLLMSACRAANDPAERGNESLAQYGVRITKLTDLVTGESAEVTEADWMADLRKVWGDGTAPEIPDAPALNEAGFLDEGVFSYADEGAGVWYYVSSTLRVTVTRHSMKDKQPHVWFEADIARSEGGDWLHCVTGSDKYKKTAEPDLMAQGWVIALNTDYYQYRVNNKYPIGLIMRAGLPVHDNSLGKLGAVGVPNLDCVLLTQEGGMSMHPAATLTSEDAAAQNAWDVLSFGPILMKDGRWSQINATYHATHEPRTAVGRLGENHYLVVFAEGRLKEAKGLSLDEMQQLMLVRGATDAINLDGGRTACLYFMGQQLGAVGNGTNPLSPRGQWEMLVIGTIEE